ncbi:MAG: hypothetical protein PF542_01275 [Nanoarchaeota archaeon]|jgi:sugar-specific transcriptional regulator TrmB|nr:hypothetical protein [Nanoarchaeota archaeon]
MEQTLQELGLTNAESKIYLALLELGSSKTGEIINQTKLQSSTIYHTLDLLVKKGLITYILEGKIKKYQAEPPETIISFLEEKKKKIIKILPQLKAKQKIISKKQTAKIFEGLNGLKSAFDDILNSLKSGEEYYFFQVHPQGFENEKIKTFLRNYHLKREEKGIKIKGLASKETKQYVKEVFMGFKHSQIKYVDEFLPTGITIYKNKMIFIDLDSNPSAITIESKSLADSYRQFFLDKWNKTI